MLTSSLEVISTLVFALSFCRDILPLLLIKISPVEANTSGGRLTPKPWSVPTRTIRLAYIPPRTDESSNKF